MSKEKLLNTLKTYEVLGVDLDPNDNKNDESAIKVLQNDINRTDFGFSNIKNDKCKVILYKNIMYETLAKFPFKYIQGMAEIATVIVDVYFNSKVNGVILESKNYQYDSLDLNDFMKISNENKKAVITFINENKTLMIKLKNSLINIYKQKFNIFFKDNFKLYRESNEVFIYCMKKKGIIINRDVSFKYMNHVLTFFKRVYSNESVAYSIYNIILNSEPCMLFTLLMVFYENVQSGASSTIEFPNMIEKIDEDTVKKISIQHSYFLKTREHLRDSGSFKKYAFFGAAASLVAIGAALAYKMTKKD